MRTIKDKIALVTGAGSGIGRAIAIRLAEAGAHLHLADIDLDAAEETAEEARRHGVRAVASRCDVANGEELDRLAARHLAEWSTIDILVNNAGIGWYGQTTHMGQDEWDRLLAINLHAPIRLTTRLLPVLLARPEAHVINMSSICGWVCSGRYAAYHVSKFGLVGFSEALRAEFGRNGLGVTAVCPGAVLTNLYKNAGCGYRNRQTPSPPAWLCTRAEIVADRTLRAIRRNQAVAVVGGMAQLLYYAKRFVPWVFYAMHTIGRGKKMREKAAKAAKSTAAHDRRKAA
jgi:short-subunit dehydrogenase